MIHDERVRIAREVVASAQCRMWAREEAGSEKMGESGIATCIGDAVLSVLGAHAGDGSEADMVEVLCATWAAGGEGNLGIVFEQTCREHFARGEPAEAQTRKVADMQRDEREAISQGVIASSVLDMRKTLNLHDELTLVAMSDCIGEAVLRVLRAHDGDEFERVSLALEFEIYGATAGLRDMAERKS